tara:strand:- start:1339 stop:2583 length:1245 start_codon:yes stop_codon:yes gene_type:complete
MVDFSNIGRRVATQIATNAFQKVAGNIKGTIFGGKSGSDTSEANKLNRNQVDVKTFQFPLDIMSDPGLGNHGHYIMFFINEQENAKLRFTGATAKESGINKAIKERRPPEFINKLKANLITGKSEVNKKRNTNALNDSIIEIGNSGAGIRAIGSDFNKIMAGGITSKGKLINDTPIVSVDRPATHRLDTAIALYMPQSLSVNYGSRYVDTEISPLGAAVGQVAEGLVSGEVQSFTDAVKVAGDKVPDALKRKLQQAGLSFADLIGATGAREAFEISRAEVITQRMELAFKNVNRRNFTYNFKMIPKNEKEAEEIRKIIYAFKFNMLPEMTTGRKGVTMSFPNTFDIEYKFLQRDNDYLHKVSTCVLENMTVTYGGDRFRTFAPKGDGAPVVETTINLAFKELELITRERIEEGF